VATTVITPKDTTSSTWRLMGGTADKTFKRSEVMLGGRVVHDKGTNSNWNRWIPSMNASDY
jgi:hypothetical protein